MNNKILLIDDDKILLNTTCQLLLVMGYKVIVAHDGAEALDIYTKRHDEIGIVISDVMMPKMKGTHAVERMREIRADLPVVFITGYSTSEVQIDPIHDHITQILTKPFRMAELRDLIIEYMGVSQKDSSSSS